MKKLTYDEIESIALKRLRQDNNKTMLSNKNVDCFCMGYNMCQNTLLDLSYNPDELAEYLLKHAEDAIDYVNTSIAYAGRQTDDDTRRLTFFKGLKNFLTKKDLKNFLTKKE